nr:unnamed protein product [Callosobruchus chinensis]
MATTIAASPSVPEVPEKPRTSLEKIESFLNDSTYKEILESSLNYNTRLCIERRLRLPFFDTQTGVAQNHSNLYMNKRQRIPGLLSGQIYTYPRQRWRKKRRQYLTMSTRPFTRAVDLMDGVDGDMHSISQMENPALQDTDSKDSQLLKDEASKEWFYDEADMLEMDAYDEPDPDSDMDYEEDYRKRRKGKKASGRGRTDSPSTPGKRKGTGRGRKKAAGHSFEPTPGDPDKPYACELCGARYKTRPGLTYHYNHSHKEGASDENSRDSAGMGPTAAAIGGVGSPTVPPPMGGAPVAPPMGGGSVTGVAVGSALQPGAVDPPQQPTVAQAIPRPSDQGTVYQDSYVSFLNQTPGTPVRRSRQPGSAPSPGSVIPPPMGGPPVPTPTGVPIPPVGGLPPQAASGAPPTLPPNLPTQQPPQPPTLPLGGASAADDPPMPVLVPEKAIESGMIPPAPHFLCKSRLPSLCLEALLRGVEKSRLRTQVPTVTSVSATPRRTKKTGTQEDWSPAPIAVDQVRQPSESLVM